MAPIRFCDNLQQWHPCSIVINQAFAVMHDCLSCVLFHLHSLDPHLLRLVICIVILKATVLHYRMVFLGYLVPLRQIRVYIVLPVEFDPRRDLTVQCE